MNDLAEFDVSLENIQRAAVINQAFKEGRQVEDVLKELRELQKPIIVDFNNVLFNNDSPFVPNPEARNFLQELSRVGDVVIATTARSWEGVQEELEKEGLWTDEIILMTRNNYNSMRRNEEFLNEFLHKRGLNLNSQWYDISPGGKPLSPIFDKPYDIPFIDDDVIAENPFPGMLGIKIKPFLIDGEGGYRTDKDRGKSLPEAVDIVKSHYATITP